MIKNWNTTTCDICNKDVDAGEAAFSEHGEYKDKDVCIHCMERLGVSNCGCCDSVYPISKLVGEYYACPLCQNYTESNSFNNVAA